MKREKGDPQAAQEARAESGRQWAREGSWKRDAEEVEREKENPGDDGVKEARDEDENEEGIAEGPMDEEDAEEVDLRWEGSN